MEKKMTMAGANLVLLIFSLLFLFFQLLLVVFAAIYGYGFINDNFYVISLISEFLLILLPVLIYCIYHRLNIKETFRFKSPGMMPVILIVLSSVPAYFVALFLNNIVAYLLQFIGKLPEQSIPIPSTVSELFIGILIIAVSPALCEEMLHRGLMLRAYERRGSYKAVFFTAIFFGLFHFDLTNLVGPIFLGLMIGYFVIRTNSIFAGMLAHFLNNAIAEVLQYISRNSIPDVKSTAISPQDLVYLGIYGVIGLLFLSLFIILLKKATVKNEVLLKPPLTSLRKDITSIFSHVPVIIVIALYFFYAGLLIVTLVFTK